jgi:hypothetical protein
MKTIFTQNIRHGTNKRLQKERVMNFIDNLHIKEGQEFTVKIEPYSSSKTLEQLGYYWTAIISTARAFQGLTVEEADQFLKKHCCTPIHKEIMGEIYEIRKSIAKMKVKEMREYIDTCINFLGSHGQAVPPPQWRE